jgi:serine/threonine protein kinase
MEDKRVAKRFQREAEAASRFSHPNSIGIYDFGQTAEGSLYIAMEYIEGRDLAEIITKEAPLTPNRAVRIVTQVLSALHLAHNSQIIHRDLKPENIMLSNLPGHKDFVKVCDFGIAKIQQQPGKGQESALTMFGMICGTPYYMSPEQAKGEELDGRTDLYSMGVILYEMLTGEVPFRGSSPVEVIARHLTDPPVPPSKLRSDLNIPRALESVVLRALSKNREERFANAEAFSEELEKALKEAEFQADLERVLQESDSPIPHTPSEALHASPKVAAVATAAPVSAPPRPTAPGASPVLAPVSSEVSEILHPSNPIQGQPHHDRNTPVPDPLPIPQQDPPVILTEEIDDYDYNFGQQKSKLPLILMLAGVAIVGLAVYFMFFSNPANNPTNDPEPRPLIGKARGVTVPRKTKQRTLPTNRKTLPRLPAVRKRIPTLPRPARRPARRPSQRRRIHKRISPRRRRHQNSPGKAQYQRMLSRLTSWKRRNRIFLVDFNQRGRRLTSLYQKAARRRNYAKANQYLTQLFYLLGNLRDIPTWAINNKYSRMNKRWSKIEPRASKAHKAKVEQLIIRVMSSATPDQKNKLMNHVFAITRKY